MARTQATQVLRQGLFYGSLCSLFLLSACGAEYKGALDGAENVATCPSNLKVESSPLFEVPEAKISRSDFLLNAQQDGILQSNSEDQFRLEKGEYIVVTVDRLCLQDRGVSKEFPLTETVQVKFKKEQYSTQESHSFELPASMNFKTLQSLAQADECVVMVSPNIMSYITALPNDPKFSSQTHLTAIKYDSVFDVFFNNAKNLKADTIIAIIDNGVDITHPELKDLLWTNTAEKNGVAGVDDDKNGYVDDIYGYDFATNVADPNHKYPASSNIGHSHGSHVAGLTAAATNNGIGVAGVMAKNAKIMSLNVFGNSNGAMTSNIDTAIRYAVDMGARVLNLSLGGRGATSSTESALKYAVSKGATVIVAAGNDTATLTSSTFYTPASYGAAIDGMITIGATDANSSKVGTICSFSNRSPSYVELGAPGCDTAKSGLLSLLRNNSYGLMSGTSMASPVAAGVAALVYSVVRDAFKVTLTPAEVESIMKKGAAHVASLDSTIQDGKNIDLVALKTEIEKEFGSLTPPIGGGTPQPTCP